MRDFAGGRNEEILPALLGRAMSAAEIATIADAKEARYRELFSLHVAPVRGAVALLDELDAHGVVFGIASAAPKPNRDSRPPIVVGPTKGTRCWCATAVSCGGTRPTG
ncbi:MAG: hypothetical protein Q8S73_01560 [Deltaproteobacteria bacterium]|nr:hypothetical protein [Myxococcales bacterium]MDP3212762.1 hypothetical protein [Deltaproteobacteria bacterium]